MNIFVLDKNQKDAVEYLIDKHVVKMVLETAQLLSTCLHKKIPIGHSKPSKLYKQTHAKHPCTLWCMESEANYDWLLEYFVRICEEYNYRYKKIHKSSELLSGFLSHKPCFDNTELTPFAQAMPSEYKCEDAVKAYRAYYREDKLKRIKSVWTLRPTPYWVTES